MLPIRLDSKTIYRALILAASIVIAGSFLWMTNMAPQHAQAQGSYDMVLTGASTWDGWAGGSSSSCWFPCGPGYAGYSCEEQDHHGYQNTPYGYGNITSYWYECRYTPPACTPSSACAGSTYNDSTCTDACGNVYQGTVPRPPVCSGSMGSGCSSSGNSCGMTNSGSIQCDGSCSASTPSNSSCPQPTCADYGQLGTYPSCYNPPQPTCADYGQLGTYPNCYNAPTCADYGQLGTYPNCYNAPTCADNGQLGSYPNCYDPAPSPSLSCTVSPSSVTAGGSATYSANPANGASSPYTWVASDGTSVGTGSTATRTFATAGTYSMNVDTSNTSVSYCPNVTVTASAGACTTGTPVLSITATPSRLRAGESTTIAWTASNVLNGASCTVSGPNISWSGASSASPSCSAASSASAVIGGQSTYTLTCGSATKSVTVNPIPSIKEF